MYNYLTVCSDIERMVHTYMVNYVSLAGLIIAGATAIGGTAVAIAKKRKSAKKEEKVNEAIFVTSDADVFRTTPLDDSAGKPKSQTNQKHNKPSMKKDFVKADDYDPNSVTVEDDLV